MLFRSSALGFLVTIVLFRLIAARPVTDKKAQHIGELIRQGAMTFLHKEYSILAVVIVLACAVLSYFLTSMAAMAYALGALSSMFAGFVGMRAATMANV